MWRHQKKAGNEFPRPYNRPRSLVSLFKCDMDSKKCLWCSDKFFAYRHYTKCCGKLYHWGCLVRETWALPPSERFWPNCKAVNLGEPYKLLPQFKELSEKGKTRWVHANFRRNLMMSDLIRSTYWFAGCDFQKRQKTIVNMFLLYCYYNVIFVLTTVHMKVKGNSRNIHRTWYWLLSLLRDRRHIQIFL